MCETTLRDALNIIDRAKSSIEANKSNGPYVEILSDIVEDFKQQILDDFTDLPIDFFDQDAAEQAVIKSDNFELTPRAYVLYDQIETSL
jgi:hypothetical protein